MKGSFCRCECGRGRAARRKEGHSGGRGEEAVADEVHARPVDHGGGQRQVEAGGDGRVPRHDEQVRADCQADPRWR